MFIPVRATPLVAATTVLAAGLVMPGLGPAPAAPASTRYRVVASLQPDTVLFGHRVTVTGAVRPGAPEKAVKLQVYADGVWHTVAVTALSSGRSRYAATYVPPRAGTYLLRVRKPPDNGLRRGTSRTLTLSVTPSLPPT